MENLFSQSADNVGKAEKSATTSVHFHPWCQYNERLWGPEVLSCLRPQDEVKKFDSLSIRETPKAA